MNNRRGRSGRTPGAGSASGDGWDENDPRWNDPHWAGPGTDDALGNSPGSSTGSSRGYATGDAMDGGTGGPRTRGELHDAAQRLERAVEDLVRTASGAVSGKATRVVDELERSARRLRDQVAQEEAEEPLMEQPHTQEQPREQAGRSRSRGSSRRDRQARRQHGGERATRNNGWLRDLYREPDRGWIAGICAGLARYYQVEPWVARLVAVSLLVFIPQIVFWAYIIGIFMLRKRPPASAAPSGAWHGDPGRSSAPEFGPRLAPRHGVRTLRVRFQDLEQRLRRLETHVTSREFTLTRELSALEREPGVTGSGRVPGGSGHA